MTSLQLHNVSIIRQGQTLLDGIALEIPAEGNLLITGASGSGKTLLLQALAGKASYRGTIAWREKGEAVQPKTVLVEQHYFFKNKSNTSSSFYYQQRFNSADAEDAETVTQAMQRVPGYQYNYAAKLMSYFDIERLKDASLLQLSSGEHKRFQIVKALLSEPQLLLLDQPYMGLDIGSRRYLNKMLNLLSEKGCIIIMVAAAKDAPACTSHVLELEGGKGRFFGEMMQFNLRSPQPLKGGSIDHQNENETSSFGELESNNAGQTKPPFRGWGQPTTNEGNVDNTLEDQSKFPRWGTGGRSFTTAVAMKNVTIRYGDKTILHNINWQVAAGEKWLLKGPNGAGKSTLISLITGDNPQAFANDIILFDRKKCSGESIWDIKKNIGYISPELQWHFDGDTTCRQAVGSGFFDTIGLFRKLNIQQEEAIQFWLRQFGLETTTDELLRTLPISKQKLVLLARAMVKNPPMLILDESCQGLDEQQKEHFLQMVEALCTKERTLLYVSHYESEVPPCIEQVIELEKGEAKIYRLTPTPLLTERGKAEANEEFILKTKAREPAITIN